MSAATWQIVLIDGLFLCLVVGIGLWVRAWLAREKERLDGCLGLLEAQHARLERVSGRLQTVCRVLELMGQQEPSGVAAKREGAKPLPPSPVVQQEESFERAWKMLLEGVEPGEVARRLDIGTAEVELMNRMLHYRRQG